MIFDIKKIYTIPDVRHSDPTKNRVICIDERDKKIFNTPEQGYGIHWLPQTSRDGESRKTEDIIKINWWIADLDEGTKEEQMERINFCCPLPPTVIVETKRGYHCYWKAIDATLENYRRIELGLAELLGGDKALQSPTHTLRCPDTWHLKDPSNPFWVHTVKERPDFQYHEADMLKAFPYDYKKPFADLEDYEMHADTELLKKMLDKSNWERLLHISELHKGNRNEKMSNIAYRLIQNGADYDTTLGTLMAIWEELGLGEDGKDKFTLGEVKGIVNGKKHIIDKIQKTLTLDNDGLL